MSRRFHITVIFSELIFCFPVYVFAQGIYTGGDGSPENPFQIADFNDLTEMRNCFDDWNKCFILTADIDLDPALPGRKIYGKAVIAPATYYSLSQPQGAPFQGYFDGNGHSIQNLYIQGTAYNGFFGWVGSRGQIRNLTIQGGAIEGNRFFGAVAAYNQGIILYCRVLGVLLKDLAPATSGDDAAGGLVGGNYFGTIAFSHAESTVEGYNNAGGLVGNNSGDIYCCTSSGNITGQSSVGGLVGYNTGSIQNCFAESSVFGENSCGGIAGTTTGTIVNCYTVSTVSGNTNVGGIAGMLNGAEGYPNVIVNSYANGLLAGEQSKGIVGSKCIWPNCMIINCFWNIDTTGTTVTAGGGTGLTDAQTRDPQVFLEGGWDFADETENGLCDDWYSPPGRQYPKLSFQHPQKSTPVPFEGKGTPEKPYLIASAEDLIFISGKSWLMDKCFDLISDIDLSDFSFVQPVIAPHIVGVSSYSYGIPFSGVFDGKGFCILNLFIDNNQSDDLGLFGRIESGVVRNLTMQRAKIYGKDRCGLLVGQLSNDGTLENCTVHGWVGGDNEIGGLVGNNLGDIARCSFEGLVWGAYDRIGGLAGIHYGGNITESCVNGSVSGRSSVGGLVGFVSSTPDYGMERCYSKGAVTGSQYAGGLVGSNGQRPTLQGLSYSYAQAIENCYSHMRVTAYSFAGGLAGQEFFSYNYGEPFSQSRWIPPIGSSCFAGQVYQTVGCGGLIGSILNPWDYAYNCYYDKDIIGNPCSAGDDGSGRTTAQMTSLSTYLSSQGPNNDVPPWDFETVWALCEGTNYPRLRWQVPAGDWVCPDGVRLNDFAALAQCWMQAQSPCVDKDLDQSGLVDGGELYALSQNWLLDVEDKKDLGLIHFGFDETSGNTVYSNINGLTGTLCNMDESSRQPGHVDGAIQFDGIDDAIVLDGFKGIPGGTARSCCAWVKMSVPGRHIIGWGTVQTGQKWVMRLDDNGCLRLDVGDGNKIATSQISDGQWHLIAAVLKAGSYIEQGDPSNSTENLELFVDGQREEVFESPVFIDTRTEGCAEFGVFSGADQPSFFEGLMDEVQIVPYSLSLEEIRQKIPQELVAHWKLDDGSGSMVHDSANHYDGALMNMDESNWDAAENALYFDGVDDYVEFPDFKGITGGKTRTCCVWIKTRLLNRQIITWGAARPTAKWVIRLHDGRLRLDVGDGYRVGYRNIADGQWHHIAVTMDYDENWPGVGPRCVALFVDGMQEPLAEVDTSPIYTSADETVKLGAYAPGSKYFCGYMRDVRIYNYALPTDQIRHAMNMPEGTLIAHWKLDEGQGMAAYDCADGHDGVLMNVDESSWDLNENAPYFDGVDDYIEIPDFKGISGPWPRTCCAWIKTQMPEKQILSWGTAATGAKWVIRLNGEGKMQVEVGDGYCVGSTPLTGGQWHHIAVKLDDSDDLSSTDDLKIYVDGLPEIISEYVSQYIQTATAENVKIGVFSNGLRYFQGYLKDIRIYDYSLDIDQIHQIIGKGPLAHWKLDEAEGLAANDSAGSQDGLLVNMEEASWDKSTEGTALRFDGIDDYVDVPGFKGIPGQASRTCCAWIKTTTAGRQILSWGTSGPGVKWIIKVDEGGALRVAVGGGWCLSSQTIDDGIWHHVAVVLSDDGSPDISEAILYVDGTASLGGHYPCPVNTSAGEDVKIGVYLTEPGYFNGIIRDVRIYDRALKASELKELYHCTKSF
ncbi:MAG: LamG domain-containing protein [Planctomycetales bacterium]|nr:LamG domain-containing protein [Planctomycetales bacterium]